MSDLPKGWAWATLGEVAPEVKTASLQPKRGTTYELWSVPSFSNGVPEIVDGGEIGSAKRPVVSDDVLICKINPRINRVWRVGESKGHPQVASPEWIAVRPSERGCATPKYLQHYLSSPMFREWIVGQVSGVTGSHTRAKPREVMAQRIPLPPLAEQRRIVEVLENHLSRLDAAEVTVETARARLIRLQALSFDEATRGRPVVESTTVGDLCEVFVGSTPSRSNPALWQGDLPWVSSGEVAFSRIADTRERIIRSAAGSPKTRIHPPGTVMIAMIGEGKTRGQVAILDIEAAHNQNCASIRIDRSKLIPEFVYQSLRSRYEQNRTTNAAGGVQPALNKSKVQQLPLPLFSLQDQREIVDEVESADHLNGRLAQALNDAQARAAALRRSLLRAAFNGELVDQDSSG